MTVTHAAVVDGPFSKSWDVTSSADGDLTDTITHGFVKNANNLKRQPATCAGKFNHVTDANACALRKLLGYDHRLTIACGEHAACRQATTTSPHNVKSGIGN